MTHTFGDSLGILNVRLQTCSKRMHPGTTRDALRFAFFKDAQWIIGALQGYLKVGCVCAEPAAAGLLDLTLLTKKANYSLDRAEATASPVANGERKLTKLVTLGDRLFNVEVHLEREAPGLNSHAIADAVERARKWYCLTLALSAGLSPSAAHPAFNNCIGRAEYPNFEKLIELSTRFLRESCTLRTVVPLRVQYA
jgi:hypothetical protein